MVHTHEYLSRFPIKETSSCDLNGMGSCPAGGSYRITIERKARFQFAWIAPKLAGSFRESQWLRKTKIRKHKNVTGLAVKMVDGGGIEPPAFPMGSGRSRQRCHAGR